MTQTAGRLNRANGLTVLRLLLVPIFWLALMEEDGKNSQLRILAWAIFALAAYTDMLDGQWARERGIQTDLGAFLDPVADKALIGAALIGLSSLGELPWWITVVILTREIGITLMRLFVIRHGVIPASRGGKAKTLVQGFAIGFYIFPMPSWSDFFVQGLMGVAIILTVVTGIDYIVKALQASRARRASA